MRNLRLILRNFKNLLIILVTPLVLLPLLSIYPYSLEIKCAFVVILMAVYWTTEAMPLPVTSFLPIFLYPFLGILSAKNTCANYLKDANFLFVGGLIVAVATEESQLHKRIALRVLLLMGPQPRWLMLGFMMPSAFLSMWMSNVATTAMMAPIATCVLAELINHAKSASKLAGTSVVTDSSSGQSQKNHQSQQNGPKSESVYEFNAPEMIDNEEQMHENGAPKIAETQFNGEPVTTEKIEVKIQSPSNSKQKMDDTKIDASDLEHVPKSLQGLCKAIMLSICFSASLGGTATLTGTGPNIVLTGQLNHFYPTQTDITFASWMVFAVPGMIICLFMCWICLQIVFVGWRSIFGLNKQDGSKSSNIVKILRMRYEELGEMSFAELSIIGWFLVLVFLWVFRDPMFIPGWQDWFSLKKGYISDACAAMLVATILFIWPNRNPFSDNGSSKSFGPLLTWGTMQKKFPWSVVILLGGGYAMADGVKASKLDISMGCFMQNAVGHLSAPMVTFVVACLVTLITQIASNSAVATVFIPVLVSLSQILRINPLYFLIPATISSSFAFMTPVGTPPNAVIFESGMITIKEMFISGSILCVLCIAVTILNLNTFCDLLFNLDEYPLWAEINAGNFTCT